jgi:hypothetical protein
MIFFCLVSIKTHSMAVMKEPVTIMEKVTDTWTSGTEHMGEPKQKLDVDRLT